MNFSDHGEQLAAIRRSVSNALYRLPVYLALRSNKQRQIAYDTVKVLNFISAGPDGITRPEWIQFGKNANQQKSIGPANSVFGVLSQSLRLVRKPVCSREFF